MKKRLQELRQTCTSQAYHLILACTQTQLDRRQSAYVAASFCAAFDLDEFVGSVPPWLLINTFIDSTTSLTRWSIAAVLLLYETRSSSSAVAVQYLSLRLLFTRRGLDLRSSTKTAFAGATFISISSKNRPRIMPAGEFHRSCLEVVVACGVFVRRTGCWTWAGGSVAQCPPSEAHHLPHGGFEDQIRILLTRPHGHLACFAFGC